MGRTAAWIFGGICCASGILNLIFSFAAPYGDMSTAIDKAGWDGIEDIAFTGRFMFSVVCIGIGVPTLIGLNAGAWKSTGGY